MDAFATVTQFATRLNRTFSEDETPWAQSLLEDASAIIRNAIEQEVFPQRTVTYTAHPSPLGREDLPQWPVVSVASVTRDDADIDFRVELGTVLVDGDDPCDITYTFGYADAPAELVRLTCVLASQTMRDVEAGIGLASGGLTALGLDDFRASWRGAETGTSIPAALEASLRQKYGRGGMTIAGVV
jgi:hypothetical protein